MLILSFGVPAPAGAKEIQPVGVADIRDSEMMRLVKEGYEKHLKKDVIGMVVMHEKDRFDFEVFDSKNRVGAATSVSETEDVSARSIDLNYDSFQWVDGAGMLQYNPEKDRYDNVSYRFRPMDPQTLAMVMEDEFGYTYMVKKTGFTLASTYYYAGNTWVYGPAREKHLCYIAEAPENDPYYLPRRIYIGVDDGEIYRIDEERFSVSSVSQTINNYTTLFFYPESVTIPENIKRNAILSGEYNHVENHLTYAMCESQLNPGTYIMSSTGEDGKTNLKSVTLPGTVTVLGKKYKVAAVKNGAFTFSRIEKITLGNNIREIGEFCFSGCSKLKKVTIGKNLKWIGAGVFDGCNKLKTIVVKNKKMKKYMKSKKGRKELDIGDKVVIK